VGGAGGASGGCAGISFGGSVAGALKDLLRLWPVANAFDPIEDLLFLSIMASDQLNPSPALLVGELPPCLTSRSA